MKNEMLTIEELIESKFGEQLGLFTREDLKNIAIEFAKLHVQAALEQASFSIECYPSEAGAILTAYPDELIK